MIGAISDLHMGSGRACDRFGHEEAPFLEFLDFLEGEYERLVLVGDVYETHHGWRFRGFRAELARCRAVRPRIDARLRGPRYEWIHGNHDEVLAALGVPWRLDVEAAGTRLLFVHGHQFDRVVQRLPVSSQFLSWSGAFLARQGVGAGLTFLDWLDDRMGGLSHDGERCRYQAVALELAAAERADVLVMGHTHLGAVGRRGGRVYVNSGACLFGRFEYAHLDVARSCFEVRRWLGGRRWSALSTTAGDPGTAGG